MDRPTWTHLFMEEEYAPRRRILAGLDLAQVTYRPADAARSIFDELWHANEWQAMLLEEDEARWRAWRNGRVHPSEAPEAIGQWNDLVAAFLSGLEETYAWATTPARVAWFLRVDGDPRLTPQAVVYGLAVHNAYHLGKIVTLRQLMGAWPPSD